MKNNRNCLYQLNFFKNLNQTLKKYFILINGSSSLTLKHNMIKIWISAFFRFKILKKYKKKTNIIELQKTKKFDFFVQGLEFFKKKFILIKIYSLNKKINKKIVYFFLKKFKSFKRKIFDRRLDLFFDFANLSSLFILNKIEPSTYLSFLVELFAIILKKKHAKYVFFLSVLFKVLIIPTTTEIIYTQIKGIKFSLNGKLKGKPRAKGFDKIVGSVSRKTFTSNIIFSKMHAYNRYGAFGFKLWINYKNVFEQTNT